MSHYYNTSGELVDPWEKGCYPSPSTILDIIKNDGIEAFRARMGEEEADAHMIMTQERGTRVHLACETWILSGGDYDFAVSHAQLQDNEEDYLIGFINWTETYKPEFVATELFLINRALGYAGRTDLVVRLDGQLWIVDIKTGVTRVKHGLQVRFYAAAYEDMLVKAGQGKQKIRMGGLYVDAKRACGYRYFKSEYGMLEYKESLAAIKAHLAVFKWWARREPVKKPAEPSGNVWAPEDLVISGERSRG